MHLRFTGLVVLLVGCVTVAADTPGDGDSHRAAGADRDSSEASRGAGDPSPFAVVDLELVDPPYLVEVGTSEALSGRVLGAQDATVSVVSDRDGGLAAPILDAQQAFEVPLGDLSVGTHTLTLTAQSAIAGSDDEEILVLGVCQWPEIQTFDDPASLGGWRLFGNAAHDAGGWLEITGNAQSRSGHI